MTSPNEILDLFEGLAGEALKYFLDRLPTSTVQGISELTQQHGARFRYILDSGRLEGQIVLPPNKSGKESITAFIVTRTATTKPPVMVN